MKKPIVLLLTIFSTCLLFSQEVTRDTTFCSEGNPVIRYKYTADPAAMVYNNKFYLYTGHDICPPKQERYVMKDWCVFFIGRSENLDGTSNSFADFRFCMGKR